MNYFDNAATTYPKPSEVYEFTDAFYRSYGVNVSRGQYKEASVAANLVNETRNLLLTLFHCNGTKEVVFTPSATIAINTILSGLNFKDGDNVYITTFEHNAVKRTLNNISKRKNINIKYLTPDKTTLEYDIDSIKSEFNLNTPDYIILNHASNVTGVITPISDIIRTAKQYDAISIVDMAQTAGLIDTNIIQEQIDFAIFAGHKTLYAPFGVAGFILDKNSSLPPFIYGGNGIDSINIEMPNEVPERFEAGSLNIQAIAGLNAALKWIDKIGIENIRNKEKNTTEKLIKLLESYSNIKVIRSKTLENQIGVISCLFDGFSSDEIGRILNNKEIAVRTGLHCCPDAHNFLKTIPAGTVRFSVSYFTCERDFLILKDALDLISENS